MAQSPRRWAVTAEMVAPPAAGMTAGYANRIAHDDPAFSVPDRPRLLPGLVVVSVEKGLLVEGGERRQVFRGQAASTWLPRLVSMLASSGGGAGWSTARLADSLGLATRQVNDAVALLYAAGLLDNEPEDGKAAGDSGVPSSTAEWVSRLMDTSRLHRSREDVVASIADSRVHVCSSPGPAAALGLLLRLHGLRTTSEESNSDLVIVLGIGRDDPKALVRVEADCVRRGAAWLRVLIHETGVELGPFGSPHDRRCATCVDAAGLLSHEPSGHPDNGMLLMGLGAAASEIVRLLSGSGRPLSSTGVMRLDLATWVHQLHVVPALPGCLACDPRDPSSPHQTWSPETAIVYTYDAAVRFPALARQRPKDHQQHYSAKNIALQHDPRSRRRRSRPLPAAPRPSLTADSQAGAAMVGFRGDLSEAPLADILHAGFGWLSAAGGEARRCAPTGGNIGSPAVHVVALDVLGLPNGPYEYASDEHGLVRLEDRGASGDLLAGVQWAAPVEHGRPAALLILTGDLERVSSKYVEFAARVIQLDAGVAVAQARLAAAARGIVCRAAVRWDDELVAHGLRIDRKRTPVTMVAGIWAATDQEV